MSRAIVLAVAFLALAGAAPKAAEKPQTSSLQADFDSLVAAERSFSKLSEAKGIKESFLANIAQDAVIFRPGPVPGKEWLAARPNPPALLAWHPVYAEISLSRDLGWTTGPYEITPEGQPKGYGQYSTVWKRQPDGQWKFILDHGITTPGPAPEGEPKLVTPEAVSEKVDAAAFHESVLAADRDLGTKAAAQGLAAAYATVATDKTYLLRDGHQPSVGKKAVQDALAQDPGGLSWEPKDGGVSGAGDLAYTYGTVSRTNPEETGAYIRVWERHSGGTWKLALDVVKLAAARKVMTPVRPPGGN